MKQLLKRFSHFSVGTVLGSIFSFIQVPILTYLLLPAEYGKAGLFRTLITQIPILLYLGIDHSYTREYHDYENRSFLMQNSMILPLINGLIFLLISFLFGSEISQWLFGSPEYFYIVWLGAIFVLFIIIERFILLTIRMEEMAKEYSLFTVLTKISAFVVTMLLIFSGMRDFRVIVFGLLFGQIIIDILLIIRYRFFFVFSFTNIDYELTKKLFLFGFPQMIAITLTSALNTVDNISLNYFSDSTNLGIYNSTLTIVSVIGILRTAFTTFWLPTAYKWNRDKKSIQHYKFISDLVLLILTVGFYLFLLCKPIVMFLIGDNYSDAQYIIGLLTLPHILATLSETTTLGILFSRRTYLNIYVGFSTFITSVLFNVLLTSSFGYRGAAISSAVAYFIYYLARTYFSKTTGFYFRQTKQIYSVLLLFIISILHMFEIPYIEIITVTFLLISLAGQKSTFSVMKELKDNNGKWDFS